VRVTLRFRVSVKVIVRVNPIVLNTDPNPNSIGVNATSVSQFVALKVEREIVAILSGSIYYQLDSLNLTAIDFSLSLSSTLVSGDSLIFYIPSLSSNLSNTNTNTNPNVFLQLPSSSLNATVFSKALWNQTSLTLTLTLRATHTYNETLSLSLTTAPSLAFASTGGSNPALKGTISLKRSSTGKFMVRVTVRGRISIRV
jgi:hypothetical protein